MVALPAAPDPRQIRDYSEAVAAPAVIEEELDYRLM
jgi:hypothetical protein